MKKKLNLTQANATSLQKWQLRAIKGGVKTPSGSCGCGCCGSSNHCDNAYFNALEGLTSPGGAVCSLQC
jgi:natural product precursor